jgi:CheY-like chemotaxis protein
MKNYTILIGDDNEEIRDYIFETLKKAGYNVISSKDPEEVLKKISECDILITDQFYGRDKRSGDEIIEEIRKHDRELPIILASSDIPKELKDYCKRSNAYTIVKEYYSPKKEKFGKNLTDLVGKIGQLKGN